MLLEITGLRTYYRIGRDCCRAVDNVSMNISKAENLGLIGESGCGKTTLAKSILRLLPRNAEIVGGSIRFLGTELVDMDEEDIRRIRWGQISLIPQSSMNALNPVHRVGDQVVEAIKIHQRMAKNEAKRRVEDLFGLVGLEKNRMRDYPHQLSGGMKQRVLIAMALALEPSLIIADEPTTALDVITQDQILEELTRLQLKFHNSIMYVTHDISVVAERCHKVAIMYAGKLMEYGSVSDVFTKPLHPYAIGLRNSFPSLRSKSLISIPGSPPSLLSNEKACRFRQRCPLSLDICSEREPTMIEARSKHFVACHRCNETEILTSLEHDREVWQTIKGF